MAKDSPRPILKRLLTGYISPHRAKLAVAIVCMVFAAAATAGHAWLIQPALDHIFVAKDPSMLWLIPAAVIGLAFVKAFTSYTQSVIMQRIGQRITATMQLDLYGHLMHSDQKLFLENSPGSLMSRFTHDIVVLREASATVLTSAVKESLTMVFLIGVMIYQSPSLSFIALVVLPLAGYPIARLGKRMRKIARQTQESLGEWTHHLEESLQGIRMIQAYGQEQAEINRASTQIERVFHHYNKAFQVRALSSPIMEFIGSCAIAGVIAYGGIQVLAGETTAGAFFSFVTAMMMAYRPLKSLSNLNTRLQEGLAACGRVFDMLDRAPTISNNTSAPALTINTGAVIFENVSFTYGNDRTTLANVSFTVEAGSHTALVGPSGSGKSTLIDLLLRFYDPTSGHISIDKNPITQCSLSSLREHIALVSQHTILFDGTIRDNILYGLPNASNAAIEQAIEHAGAKAFIADFPQGLDTPIGAHGMALSGGQRQRIAIARALLKDAPILLLDEATSALDSESEHHIQEALHHLMKGRTVISIAHRLSSIRHADHIVVLKDGQIIEEGGYEPLSLNKQSHFAQMLAWQKND